MSTYDLEALYNAIYKANDMLHQVMQHSEDLDKLIFPQDGICCFDALKSINALIGKIDELTETCESFEDRCKKYII